MRPLLFFVLLGVLLAGCSALDAAHRPTPRTALAQPIGSPAPARPLTLIPTAYEGAPPSSPVAPVAPGVCLGRGAFPPALATTQYGVNAFLLATDAGRALDLAQNAEFGWVRQQIHWRDIEGARGRYVWAPVDQVVAAAAAHHMLLMLSVVRSPDWAAPNDGLPTDTAAFAHFMGRLAARYRGRVAAYQIWNEPNLAVENGGTPATPAAYLATLRAAYPAVKAADPCALVISAAMASTSAPDPRVAASDLDFLDQLYRLDGGAFLRSADIVDLHPGGGPFAPGAAWPADQPAAAASYFRRIEQVRAIMRRYHDPRQAWISEVGWAVSRAPGAPAPVTPALQADYLVAALRQVRKEYGWISGVFVWNLNFSVIGGPADEKATFGILNPDWSPRPAYMALQSYLHARAREADRVRPVVDGPAPYLTAWSAGISGKSHATPLRAPDGTVYVGVDPGYLYAFGPNGGLLWRFQAPGGVRSAPALGPGRTILVADDSGGLSALSPAGKLLWQRSLGGTTRGSPLLVNGAILISVDSSLVCLNLQGEPIWRRDLGADAAPLARVDAPRGSLLVVGAADGTLAAFDLGGRQIWRQALGAGIVSPVAPDRRGNLLVGDAEGVLHSLDAQTGAQRWARPLVRRADESQTMIPGGPLIVAPPLVAADGTIYQGGRDGGLSALSADGAIRWRYTTGSDITSTPIQRVDGTLIVALLDWRVLGMSPAGDVDWSIRLNGAVRTTPLYAAGGDLYVSTVGGRVYALRSQDG